MAFQGHTHGNLCLSFGVEDVKEALRDGGEGDAAELINATAEAVLEEWDLDTKEGREGAQEELLHVAGALDKTGIQFVQALGWAIQRLPDKG